MYLDLIMVTKKKIIKKWLSVAPHLYKNKNKKLLMIVI